MKNQINNEQNAKEETSRYIQLLKCYWKIYIFIKHLATIFFCFNFFILSFLQDFNIEFVYYSVRILDNIYLSDKDLVELERKNSRVCFFRSQSLLLYVIKTSFVYHKDVFLYLLKLSFVIHKDFLLISYYWCMLLIKIAFFIIIFNYFFGYV